MMGFVNHKRATLMGELGLNQKSGLNAINLTKVKSAKSLKMFQREFTAKTESKMGNWCDEFKVTKVYLSPIDLFNQKLLQSRTSVTTLVTDMLKAATASLKHEKLPTLRPRLAISKHTIPTTPEKAWVASKYV